jgi:hypothetical protein
MKKANVKRVLVSIPKGAIDSVYGTHFPGQNQNGYGKQISTSYMVQLEGSNRRYRVYCCLFSNSGTQYIKTKQGDLVVHDAGLSNLI